MQLAAPEEVWRAVIQWGQRHAGVTQTMLLWAETDRLKMKEALKVIDPPPPPLACLNLDSLHHNDTRVTPFR